MLDMGQKTCIINAVMLLNYLASVDGSMLAWHSENHHGDKLDEIFHCVKGLWYSWEKEKQPRQILNKKAHKTHATLYYIRVNSDWLIN